MPTKTTNSRKGIPAGAVLAHAIEAVEAHRKTNAWLQEAAGFDHNLLLSPAKRVIARKLFHDLTKGQRVCKRTQKELDFEVLCANLLYHKQRRPIAISLNRKDWRQNRYRRASYFTMEGGFKMLLHNGLIEMRKGYGHKTKSLAKRTKIWPTVKLLDKFEPIQIMDDCILTPVELVRLRAKEDKRNLEYKDSKMTNRVREILQKVNACTDKSLVQFIDPKGQIKYRLQTRLHCVYTGDFKHDGRFYTAKKHGYQHWLLREERASIYIDGLPTVELDFSGMLPRIFYTWLGIQYNEDPYKAVMDDPPLRPIIKKVFLAALNSDSEVKAIGAGNKSLYDDRNHALLRSRGLTIKAHLLPRIKEVHKPLAKYFFKRMGSEAMNTDAKIALKILSHFADDDIPILSIHDSFIVQRQYKHRLYKAMRDAYKEVTGGYECPIKTS